MAHTNGVVKFDLSKLGMDDLEDFIVSMQGSKFREAAEVMARCCVKCPAEWGAADKAETFYKRPPVGEWAWKDVVGAMMAEVNNAGEA